ncbi:FxLD family lanthipeptide [Actinomadura sp. 21ATH]
MTMREPLEADEFDLDISVLESGDASADLIVLTDDGCGSTCASPCATNVV